MSKVLSISIHSLISTYIVLHFMFSFALFRPRIFNFQLRFFTSRFSLNNLGISTAEKRIRKTILSAWADQNTSAITIFDSVIGSVRFRFLSRHPLHQCSAILLRAAFSIRYEKNSIKIVHKFKRYINKLRFQAREKKAQIKTIKTMR